jgi:hypothetical protein
VFLHAAYQKYHTQTARQTNTIGLLAIHARGSSGHVTQSFIMASSHSRNASTADRRSVNVAGIASRAAPVRAREYEKPFVRDDGSPVLSENSANTGHADRAFDKSTRQTSDFERRTERTFTTTKEKTIRTRSPVKESASAGNRREPDRVRRSVQSPIEKKKAKEVEQGMLRVRQVLASALTICRTMDALCCIDSSFFRSSSHTDIRSAPIIHRARFSSTTTST